MEFIEKLRESGLDLPEITQPGGNYQSVNIRNKTVFVAIQFPIYKGKFLYLGRLGNEISTQDGYNAMQLCALNVLSQIHAKVGFDRVAGLNHIDAYYRAIPGWDESPKVANGASDLFVKVLEEKGLHSRGLYGVLDFPRNFSVGLVTTWSLV